MFPTTQLEEKYSKIRKNFCFYLDIPDVSLCRSISRRLQEMGLREEVFLSSRVTHVVGEGRARCSRRDGARADAMLERLRVQPLSTQHNYVQLTVQKAINLLDKLYDTFFTRARKAHVNYFSKHYIKIEFLDKACRPIYKEFDKWPRISLEHDQIKENKEKKEKNKVEPVALPSEQKMTRKSRPSRKAGYCEMCNTDYVDAALHRRSPHHLAFVRDHTNFIALDSLISSGADVATFLDKTTPVNGERRSLRKICNGDAEKKRTKQSQSPDLNGSISPKRNGVEEERKHNTRCSKKTSESQSSEDRQYYKVVSTKLRSSGGFAKQKDPSTTCNGTKPLVVKFRKVRRSELSVLSDEAEQFMFPKRASSTSSSSSDDDDKDDVLPLKRKTPPQPLPSIERQRQARPIALKEESSEEDMWPEDKRRRKRRAPAVGKRSRRVSNKPPLLEVATQPPEPDPKVEEAEIPPMVEETPQPEAEVCPLREEPMEKCMKWEDGKLKYTPAVEQLEFAFESVPKSEPWFETFKRQDQNKFVAKNVPRYFALYSKSPKLPYEIGQLPPLKPNCCPLSDLVKQREEKPGPSRSYGTRGMKKEKIRKRTAAILALESHPRKSPREHASTLAILGSAGLLHRRRNGDDAKSTASEDTVSDTHSHLKIEPLLSENQEASERLQQFLSEVFDDPVDLDVCDELLDDNTNIIVGQAAPDVSSLVSECEGCDIIRKEIDATVASQPKGRRGKFKKKNKTGWPNKRKTKKNSNASSTETDPKTGSTGTSSIEPPDDDTTQSSISEEETLLSETEKDESTVIEKSDDSRNSTLEGMDIDSEGKDSEDQPLKLTLRKSKLDLKNSTKDDKTSSQSEDLQDKAVKVRRKKKGLDRESDVPKDEEQSYKLSLRKSKTDLKDGDKDDKVLSNSSEDSEEKEKSRKKRRTFDSGGWLQPIVRVARVDPNAGRRLRSAGRVRSNRFR